MESRIGLHAEYGESPALMGVHVQGTLDGLVLTMKVRQHYRNQSANTLETIYTFPAGWGTELLGFHLEIGGKRLQAQASPIKQAEATYEEAISEGDTPVMIEKSSQGLFTANIGNLKPGEDAIIEIEYAQLQRLDQNQVRLTIPTVIGQRYGNAQTQGGLKAHQQVHSSMLVQYPLTGDILFKGEASRGQITCPSHAIELKETSNGVHACLKSGASLDRDWVLQVNGLPSTSFASACVDGKHVAVVAAFCPQFTSQTPLPMHLKVLVDCSGSMGGDSIDQAREAMHELVMQLTPRDHMSYSRFGTTVQHSTPRMLSCSAQYLQEVLAPAIHETDANMGGTELHAALTSTFAIRGGESDRDTDVLLITDGDVWDIEALVKEAQQTHHRIFAIGVGSSPAESLLRQLAEQSGGACELVTPNENMAEAVMRMLVRIRSARTEKLNLKWKNLVTWQSELPKQVFAGETFYVYALLKHVEGSDLSLCSPTLSWQSQGVQHQNSPESLVLNTQTTMARLVAAKRVASLQDEKLATEIAMSHQLLSAHTHLILVHERSAEDKAKGLPHVHNITHMHAAGHSGVTTVNRYMQVMPMASLSDAAARVWFNRQCNVNLPDNPYPEGMNDIDIPAFLTKNTIQRTARPTPSITAHEWIQAFNDWALQNSHLDDFVQHAAPAFENSDIECMFSDLLQNSSHDMNVLYALFMLWVLDVVPDLPTLSRHAQRVLTHQLQAVGESEQLAYRNLFEERLGLSPVFGSI